MPKAIDMHVHLPTASFLDGAVKPFKEPAEAFFRSKVPVREMDEVARVYEDLDILAVLLAWDAETATGLPPLTNDEVSDVVKRYPRQFVGFASVDPWKGQWAVDEMRRAITELGLIGAKFHPGIQAFYPNDRQFYPLYEEINKLGVPALFHTGQTGVGAQTRGGSGIRLKYSNPMHLDDVAADFPDLQIVMAHPAVPWQDEQLSVAVHKPNVWIDLSGWAPKYFEPKLVQYANTLLKERVLFGTDYPVISPDRWLSDFEKLPIKPEVRPLILKQNAVRLLRLAAS